MTGVGGEGATVVGEFAATLQQRLRDAHAALTAATAAGDPDLTEALLGEIELLRRIAASHGVPEPRPPPSDVASGTVSGRLPVPAD